MIGPMKTPLPAIIILALAGLTAWKFAETGQLKLRIATLEAEVNTWKAAARPPVDVAKSTAAKDATMQAPSKDAVEPKEEKEEKGKKADEPNAFAKALTTMMSSEDGRKMMKEGSKAMLEGLYKDLFDLLELDPATKAALMDALATSQQDQQEIGMRLLTAGKLSKEEREKLAAELKTKKAEHDAKIKGILKEPGQFEQFERYEDSAPERMQIATLKGKFATDGQPITEDQEQKLMDVMYSERKNMKWDYDYADQQDINPAKFSEEAIDRYTEQQKIYDANVDTKLKDTLNDAQMESFRSQRTQTRAMEKMGLGFAKSIFGESK